MSINTSFFSNKMGFHLTGNWTCWVISLKIYPRDRTGEIMTVYCWNGHHVHLIWHWVFLYGVIIKGLVYIHSLFLQAKRNPRGKSLRHWKMLHKICCSMFDRSWTTDLMCVVSWAMHMFKFVKFCEIIYKSYISLNLLFQF